MPADNELQIFSKYKKNNFFLETGAYLGDGIRQALLAGYEKIISIELSDHHFNLCTQKFHYHDNVKIVFGDSADVMLPVIMEIDEPITFWLDGHYSCGNTALGKHWSPLLQELDAISQHPINTHTIIVDDMRCWNSSPQHPFTWVEVEEKIKLINPKYVFNYFKTKEQHDALTQKSWPEGLLGDILVATVDETTPAKENPSHD